MLRVSDLFLKVVIEKILTDQYIVTENAFNPVSEILFEKNVLIYFFVKYFFSWNPFVLCWYSDVTPSCITIKY